VSVEAQLRIAQQKHSELARTVSQLQDQLNQSMEELQDALAEVESGQERARQSAQALTGVQTVLNLPLPTVAKSRLFEEFLEQEEPATRSAMIRFMQDFGRKLEGAWTGMRTIVANVRGADPEDTPETPAPPAATASAPETTSPPKDTPPLPGPSNRDSFGTADFTTPDLRNLDLPGFSQEKEFDPKRCFGSHTGTPPASFNFSPGRTLRKITPPDSRGRPSFSPTRTRDLFGAGTAAYVVAATAGPVNIIQLPDEDEEDEGELFPDEEVEAGPSGAPAAGKRKSSAKKSAEKVSPVRRSTRNKGNSVSP
jgi:pyruvate/2-oxoglutarate dehydrogenase complex dihydrolipoamide acyltransferase (E2) component